MSGGKLLTQKYQFWYFNPKKFSIVTQKLQILGGKSIKIGIFGVKSFPPLIFFPTPTPLLLFSRIFTYVYEVIPGFYNFPKLLH